MPSELDDAIDDYWETAEEIDRLKAENAKRAAYIASSLEVGEKRTGARTKGVTLAAGQRRFSPKKAGQVLPADLLEMILVHVPDHELAKRYLPAELVDQCKETVSAPFLSRAR